MSVVLPVLADDYPLNDTTVSPGVLGFAFFIAFFVALFFLIRSMNKRLRNINAPREADLKQEAWERRQAAAGGAKPAE